MCVYILLRYQRDDFYKDSKQRAPNASIITSAVFMAYINITVTIVMIIIIIDITDMFIIINTKRTTSVNKCNFCAQSWYLNLDCLFVVVVNVIFNHKVYKDICILYNFNICKF